MNYSRLQMYSQDLPWASGSLLMILSGFSQESMNVLKGVWGVQAGVSMEFIRALVMVHQRVY